MNQHQKIMERMEIEYALIGAAIVISANVLAVKVYNFFVNSSQVDPHIQYTSLEHMKSMARKFLAKKNDPRYAATDEAGSQGSLFSGELQARYPIPTAPGSDPEYKIRSALTPEERAWNVERLRKASKSLQEHADALEAEGRGHRVA